MIYVCKTLILTLRVSSSQHFHVPVILHNVQPLYGLHIAKQRIVGYFNPTFENFCQMKENIYSVTIINRKCDFKYITYCMRYSTHFGACGCIMLNLYRRSLWIKASTKWMNINALPVRLLRCSSRRPLVFSTDSFLWKFATTARPYLPSKRECPRMRRRFSRGITST